MSETKHMNETVTPLPCPHCGGMPIQVGLGVESDPWVGCRSCRVMFYGSTLQEAVEGWNYRVDTTNTGDLLVALKMCLFWIEEGDGAFTDKERAMAYVSLSVELSKSAISKARNRP